jgi:type IV pilus assembly protein PilZ
MTDSTRRFPRIPVHLDVHFGTADDLRAAVIDSLSEGGVFIRTRSPLPIGTELTLSISLGNQGDPPITLRGRVAWARHHSAAVDGMGVAFLDPPPPALKNLLISRGG